jgi:hypothetical protein
MGRAYQGSLAFWVLTVMTGSLERNQKQKTAGVAGGWWEGLLRLFV